MLDEIARVTRYLSQTGRGQLTERQRRRVEHKRNRQLPEAQDRREGITQARVLAAAGRAQHRSRLSA